MLAKVQGGNKDFLNRHCGLPISTYLSALKLRWLIDNIAEVRVAILLKTAACLELSTLG